MLRMARPTNPRPAFCANSVRISPSRMTPPTESILTPTAAALIRRRFSGWLTNPAPTLVSPTMATPIALCCAMKTANWLMAMRFWPLPALIYCARKNYATALWLRRWWATSASMKPSAPTEAKSFAPKWATATCLKKWWRAISMLEANKVATWFFAISPPPAMASSARSRFCGSWRKAGNL